MHKLTYRRLKCLINIFWQERLRKCFDGQLISIDWQLVEFKQIVTYMLLFNMSNFYVLVCQYFCIYISLFSSVLGTSDTDREIWQLPMLMSCDIVNIELFFILIQINGTNLCDIYLWWVYIPYHEGNLN